MFLKVNLIKKIAILLRENIHGGVLFKFSLYNLQNTAKHISKQIFF